MTDVRASLSSVVLTRTAPEVVVEVDGDSGVGLSDGHGRAEVGRHLQEAEGGRGGEGGDNVVLEQASAQVGGEVDGGQQAAIGDVIQSWRAELKKRPKTQDYTMIICTGNQRSVFN